MKITILNGDNSVGIDGEFFIEAMSVCYCVTFLIY